MKTIGNYGLINRIGQGGMGSVYLGEDLDTGMKVAIKVIKAEMVTQAKVLARFRQEIKVSKDLAHPFVIKILDGGVLEDTNNLYMVMEYLNGKTFTDVFRSKRISNKGARVILLQMAEALSYIHQRNIIHRDIKPDNLLIISPERSVLLDFGLALQEDLTRLSKTSDRPGTWLTMSPEQLLGKKLDGRSDIFSLGVTMYWAMTGKPPYTTQDMTEILSSSYSSLPVPPHEASSKRDQILSEIVMRCLDIDVKARFDSAEHLLSAIESNESGWVRPGTAPIKEIAPLIEPDSKDSAGIRRRARRRADSSNSHSGANTLIASSSSLNPIQGMGNSPSKSAIFRKMILGFTSIIILVGLLLLSFSGRKNQGQDLQFASKVIDIKPFSSTIQLFGPQKDIHIEVSSSNSENPQKFYTEDLKEPEKIDESEIPFTRLELEDLQASTTYSYKVFGIDKDQIHHGRFTTSAFADSLTLEDNGATSVIVSFIPNHSRDSIVTFLISTIDLRSRVQSSYGKRVVSAPCKEDVKIRVILEGLKPSTKYSIAMSATVNHSQNQNIAKADVALLKTTCSTEKVLEIKLPQVIQKNGEGNLSNLVPGISDAWGEGKTAHSAKETINGHIIYSYDKSRLCLLNIDQKKVVKEVPTPGKTNLALQIRGKDVYFLQSPFRALGSKSDTSASVMLKVCEASSLNEVKTISLPKGCSRDVLHVFGDLAVVWAPVGEDLETGNFLAFSLTSDKELWRSTSQLKGKFSTISTSGNLWSQDGSKGLNCLSLKDGLVKSRVVLTDWIEHSPVTVSDSIAAIMMNGRIAVIDEKTGKKQSTIETGQTIAWAQSQKGKLYCLTTGTRFLDRALNKNIKGRLFALDFKVPSKLRETFSLSKESFGNPKGSFSIKGRYLYYNDAFYNMNCVDIIDRRYLYGINSNRNREMHIFPYGRGIVYCYSALDLCYLVDKTRALPGDLKAETGAIN